LDALENIIKRVDKVVVGGGMAFTFLKAKGYQVGKSLVEDDLIETAKNIMKAAQERQVEFLLPLDCVVAPSLDPAAPTTIQPVDKIPADGMGLDIGPQTRALFTQALKDAKTIVWNGPMGVFEMEPFSKGTQVMVETVAQSSAFTFVGGGDTDTALAKWNAMDKMSYVSTAGGAFLEMLEGKKLPAIEALQKGV
ncbi:MAG TPA: phosphoglycerate kinase, partial [Thermodesulfobacteriota bacterium]|nr:phosphoglycerate kinase [Thermodesulfobacteriota bacterium]